MEQLELKKYSMFFKGAGSEYFGIVFVNAILSIITLGFYYPWAKARQLTFLYKETYLESSNFTFHGTGNEMFKGYIKFLGLMILIYAIGLTVMINVNEVIGILLLYISFISIVPLAIHGSLRYRMSKTTWRGIRFGYRGDRGELIKSFFKWILLTFVTLGIYGSWLTVNLRNYLFSNIRFGNLKFEYKADGFDYFKINLTGVILSILSLGIYSFWYQKDLFEFFVNHLILRDNDGKYVRFKATATGGDFFFLTIVNLLILIFTLGIGFPFVETRVLEFVFNKIELKGNIDLDAINQTEEIYSDATGEETGDFFDIDLIF